MSEQGRKLMMMLNTAVNGLDNLPALVEPLKNLGQRHVDYGVTDEDYGKVADAFLWTLQQGLGPEFTPEVKEAWVVTYTTVADVMKSGAAGVRAA
jgi:hemoglobin-like flavoprotein